MAKVLYPVTACFKKADTMEDQNKDLTQPEEENKGKVDPQTPESQSGIVWRISSGLYNIGSGAIGLGVGSVKWAASTTYNVGSGVVSATQNAVSKVKPGGLTKSKKE